MLCCQYAIGNIFCLCGGQEHRVLKLSQLQCDSDKYEYNGNVSKNQNGSFKKLHVKSKVVPIFPCPEALIPRLYLYTFLFVLRPRRQNRSNITLNAWQFVFSDFLILPKERTNK